MHRIHDSQMVSDSPYKLKESVKQLSAQRLSEPHQRRRTLSGVLLIQHFILSDASLYRGGCLKINNKQTYRLGYLLEVNTEDHF